MNLSHDIEKYILDLLDGGDGNFISLQKERACRIV